MVLSSRRETASVAAMVDFAFNLGASLGGVTVGLPLLDSLAGSDTAAEFRQVQVLGLELLAVLNHYKVAARAVAGSADHLAVASREDRRSGGCCVVDAAMGHYPFSERVQPTQIEV